MSNFIVNTDIPNLKVVIREGDAYNINIVPGRINTVRTGSFTSYADLAGLAVSASYVSGTGVFAESSSYAITASYAENLADISAFPYSGSAVITGSLFMLDTANQGGITGSLYGTASVADGIDVIIAGVYETGSSGTIIPTPSGGLSYITSASYALTASYAAFAPLNTVYTDENHNFPITFLSGSVIAKNGGTLLFNPSTDLLQISGGVGVDAGAVRISRTGIFYVSGGVHSTSINRFGLFNESNSEYIGLMAQPYELASTRPQLVGKINPGIYIHSGSTIDTAYIPLEFQGSASYTDGRITANKKFVAKEGIEVTGSLTISGSSTLTNIGPAVFSGSVTVVEGITGSFSGTITTASYAVTASYAMNGGGGGGSGSSGTSGTSGQNGTSGSSGTSGTSGSSGSSGTSGTSSLVNTGSFATTGSNVFAGNQTITGSLNVTQGITGSLSGSITSASYALTASYAQNATVTVPAGTVSSSTQVIAALPTGTISSSTQLPTGTVSSSTQVSNYNIFATTGSNQFNGNQVITGSLTVSTAAVVSSSLTTNSSSLYLTSGSNLYVQNNGSAEVTGSLIVSGNFVLPTGAPAVPQTGSMYFSGSFIYVYTGTQYRSASLA